MYQVIIVVHVLLGLGVIGLILMQQGKGADAGAAFGSGSSGSVFGAQGAASFLSRTTAILATLFFTTSLTLAVFNSHQSKKADLMDTVEVEQKTVDIPLADKSAPATPAAAAPATDTPVVANDAAVAVTATPATPVASEGAVATENKEAKAAVENKAADVAPEKAEKPADAVEKKDEAAEKKSDDKKAEKKHDSEKKKSSEKHAKKHQSDADKKDKK